MCSNNATYELISITRGWRAIPASACDQFCAPESVFAITAWMAGNPGLLLATNFGAPESVFAKFPKGAVVLPEQS